MDWQEFGNKVYSFWNGEKDITITPYLSDAIFYEVISNVIQRQISISLHKKVIDLSNGIEIIGMADRYIEFLNSNVQAIREIVLKNSPDFKKQGSIDKEINLLKAITEICIKNTDKEIEKVYEKHKNEEITH